jgi:hypothetical protein
MAPPSQGEPVQKDSLRDGFFTVRRFGKKGWIGMKSINKGVAALSREVGLSTSRITKRLKAGETPEQIRASVKARGIMRGGRKGAGTKKLREQAHIDQAAAVGKVYVPARAGKRAQLFDAKGSTSAADSPEHTLFPPPEPMESELDARRRKEIALANERELLVAQRAGALVTVATVNQWFAGSILKARDMLLRIGGELAEKLAAEETPANCKAIVDGEVSRALNVLRLMGRDGAPVDVETEREHDA